MSEDASGARVRTDVSNVLVIGSGPRACASEDPA